MPHTTVNGSKKSDRIPQFYFPKKISRTINNAEIEKGTLCIESRNILDKVLLEAYKETFYLSEGNFHAVTKACGLPHYMNFAFFRAISLLNGAHNDQLSFEEFKKGWNNLTQDISKDADKEELIFCILKKPYRNYISTDELFPVLEDIVSNHPSLQFLSNNITFQDRYIETIICRILYDAHCLNGRLTLKQFRKSRFPSILLNLTPTMDLYTENNVFSYKQFYVIYYKLWSLDTDHDLAIDEGDLYNYNMGALTPLSVKRIIEVGRVFRLNSPLCIDLEPERIDQRQSLSYLDFIWFLLSEVDKSTPMAIEYWFRCLDLDNDGVITSYELSRFWHDQDIKQQQFYGSDIPDDDYILFDDIMRQMNDLVRPEIPGQFYLRDLKKNGFIAERFFDTFTNFDRLRVHDSRQEGSVRQKEAFQARLFNERGLSNCCEPTILSDDLGFPVLCEWNDYANIEYQRIIVDENYVNSYEEEDEEDTADYAYNTATEQPNYYCGDAVGDYYSSNDTDENATDNNSDDYSTSLSSSPSLSSSGSSDDKLIANDAVLAAFTKVDFDKATAVSNIPIEESFDADSDGYLNAFTRLKLTATDT